MDRALNLNFCGLNFQTKYAMNKHRVTAHKVYLKKFMKTENLSFNCKECRLILKSKYFLRQHQQTIHGKMFRCNACNEEFNSKVLLTKHRRNIHC